MRPLPPLAPPRRLAPPLPLSCAAGPADLLVPILIGLPVSQVSPGLGADAEQLCAVVGVAMPHRVRVDLLVGLLCIDGEDALHDAKTVAGLNALLAAACLAPSTPAAASAAAAQPGGTHVLYPPAFFPDLKKMLDKNAEEAAAANVGAAAASSAGGAAAGAPAAGSAKAAAAKKPAAPPPPPAATLAWRDAHATRTASVLFSSLYESLVRVASGPLSTAPGLARVFLETVAPGSPTARGLGAPASVIWSSVLSLRFLEVLADTLCTSRQQFTAQATAGSGVLAALGRIFKTDYPELAPPFFLSCVRDQPSLEWLLSDDERLHALHLPEDWHVPPAGDKSAAPQRAFGLMTFQIDTTMTHPWAHPYADLVRQLSAPGASRATVAAWAAAEAAAGEAQLYRARALLVVAGASCALPPESLLSRLSHPIAVPPPQRTSASGSPGAPARPSSTSSSRAPPPRRSRSRRMSAACTTSSRRARSCAATRRMGGRVGAASERGSGMAPTTHIPRPFLAADDLRFLFSSESLTEAEDTEGRATERSAFILALAVIVGIPPAKNYFHMAAFEPEMLDSQNGARSQGLGSGYSCVG